MADYLHNHKDFPALLQILAEEMGNEEVQKFIGTPEYEAHKQKRFPKADLEIPISENEAFLLSVPAVRSDFRKRYEETVALYYKSQPDFDELLCRIKRYLDRL